MRKINWDLPAKDCIKMDAVVQRAVDLYKVYGLTDTVLDIEMDITACHLNGTPLDLDKLLAASDETFAHDILGIRKHINRETGQIERHFLPKCHGV